MIIVSAADIGRKVKYINNKKAEYGIINSFNDSIIFVKYDGDIHSKGTRPEDLKYLKYVKDLPQDNSLEGVIVRTPDGIIGRWRSQWNKGVWLKCDDSSNKMTPISVDKITDALEWEVLETITYV